MEDSSRHWIHQQPLWNTWIIGRWGKSTICIVFYRYQNLKVYMCRKHNNPEPKEEVFALCLEYWRRYYRKRALRDLQNKGWLSFSHSTWMDFGLRASLSRYRLEGNILQAPNDLERSRRKDCSTELNAIQTPGLVPLYYPREGSIYYQALVSNLKLCDCPQAQERKKSSTNALNSKWKAKIRGYQQALRTDETESLQTWISNSGGQHRTRLRCWWILWSSGYQ